MTEGWWDYSDSNIFLLALLICFNDNALSNKEKMSILFPDLFVFTKGKKD